MMTLYPYEQLPNEGTKQAVWQYVQSIRQCRDRQHPIYQFFVEHVIETVNVDIQLYGLQHVAIEKVSPFMPMKLALKDVSPIWSTRLVKLFDDAHVPFLKVLQQVAPKAYVYQIEHGHFQMVQQEELSMPLMYSVLQHVLPHVEQTLCTEHMTAAEETWLQHMYEAYTKLSVDTVNAYLTLLLAQALEEIDNVPAATEQSIYWSRIEERFKGDALLFTEEGQYICTFLQFMNDEALQQQFTLYDKESMLDTYAYIQ